MWTATASSRRSAARPLPSNRTEGGSRGLGRGGYTLVEVVVSMLLTAVMVSSVMSVALSGKKTSGKSDRRLIADEQARRLTQILNNYVTGDNTGCTPACYGGSSWQWVAPTQDDCGTGTWPTTCYALAQGSHTLKLFLPDWLEAAPYNGTAVYYVSYPQTYAVAGGSVPVVSVTVNWNDQ